MKKNLSCRILLFALLAATSLLVVGVFYIVKAHQLFQFNGISILRFCFGAYDIASIRNLDFLLLGNRVLILGITKIWLSVTIYLLVFSRRKWERESQGEKESQAQANHRRTDKSYAKEGRRTSKERR